jgi:hypothetical protein
MSAPATFIASVAVNAPSASFRALSFSARVPRTVHDLSHLALLYCPVGEQRPA